MTHTDLATRCPACKTVFRVVPDQLKVSAGWVRCGRCAEVFNAHEALVEAAVVTTQALPDDLRDGHSTFPPTELAPQAPPPASNTQEADTTEPGAGWAFGPLVSSLGSSGSAGLAASGPAGPIAPAVGPADAKPQGKTDRAGVESGAAESHLIRRAPKPVPGSPSERPAASDSFGPPIRVGASAPAAPIEKPEAAEAPERSERPERPKRSAPEFSPLADSDFAATPAAGAAALASAALAPAEPRADLDAAPLAPEPLVAPEPASALAAPVPEPLSAPVPLTFDPVAPMPSFVRRANRAARWHSPAVRLALLAACALAASGLAAQAGYQYRDELAARWPAAQPVLQRACAALGCDINAARAIDGLVIESIDLSRLDKVSELHGLTVALRNQRRYAVALPALELSLTDPQGRLVARRVLLPQELGASRNGAVAAQGEATLQGTLALALGSAAGSNWGYTIVAFYP